MLKGFDQELVGLELTADVGYCYAHRDGQKNIAQFFLVSFLGGTHFFCILDLFEVARGTVISEHFRRRPT